jgi:fibronectin-binding autotransporter adhesin
LAATVSTTATYTGLISGTGGLAVGDGTHLGTVALTNLNYSYTGGTTVSRATLSVAHDANLGDLGGGLTLDGGKLVVSDGFLSFRSIALTANGGTLAAAPAGTTDFQGNITGTGDSRLAMGRIPGLLAWPGLILTSGVPRSWSEQPCRRSPRWR